MCMCVCVCVSMLLICFAWLVKLKAFVFALAAEPVCVCVWDCQESLSVSGWSEAERRVESQMLFLHPFHSFPSFIPPCLIHLGNNGTTFDVKSDWCLGWEMSDFDWLWKCSWMSDRNIYMICRTLSFWYLSWHSFEILEICAAYCIMYCWRVHKWITFIYCKF